ncbi:MAG: NAD-dependent epimerase/dehydratase family protein [Gammaproteobacteria bacterium]
MDKVVVIGGSGFMGSHTADELSNRGFDVTIFDKSISPWLKENQNMIEGDMLDIDQVSKAIKEAKFVYHFGGVADIGDAKKIPFETINHNVISAAVVMEAAAKEGVKRIIYASTMYVYSPYGSFYRASKQAAETIIEAYTEEYSLEHTLLRYGSLYGPRAQEWNGLKRYVDQVIRDGKLNYSGTGSERREYIHVKDAARLSVDILDERHKNQAITVTGNQVLNSNELIDMIFEIAGVKKEVIINNKTKSNDHYTMTPYRYTPKAAKKLVPDEFIDLGQGIFEIVEDIYNEIDKES